MFDNIKKSQHINQIVYNLLFHFYKVETKKAIFNTN